MLIPISVLPYHLILNIINVIFERKDVPFIEDLGEVFLDLSQNANCSTRFEDVSCCVQLLGFQIMTVPVNFSFPIQEISSFIPIK